MNWAYEINHTLSISTICCSCPLMLSFLKIVKFHMMVLTVEFRANKELKNGSIFDQKDLKENMEKGEKY